VAKTAAVQKSSSSSPAPARKGAPASAPEAAVELDRVIHEKSRLAMVSALAVTPSLTFNELKAILKASDGNVSVHARKLEEAGYLTVKKSFEGRMPRTEYSLTAAGRRALERYLGHMEAIIRAARGK
jgi:DNA-binding transcriptional ArsR family regulator